MTKFKKVTFEEYVAKCEELFKGKENVFTDELGIYDSDEKRKRDYSMYSVCYEAYISGNESIEGWFERSATEGAYAFLYN